jgi:hypothetical protein
MDKFPSQTHIFENFIGLSIRHSQVPVKERTLHLSLEGALNALFRMPWQLQLVIHGPQSYLLWRRFTFNLQGQGAVYLPHFIPVVQINPKKILGDRGDTVPP